MMADKVLSYLDKISASSPLTISSSILSPINVPDEPHQFAVPHAARRELPDGGKSALKEISNADLDKELKKHERMVMELSSNIRNHPERHHLLYKHMLILRNILCPSENHHRLQANVSPGVDRSTSSDSTTFMTARSHLTSGMSRSSGEQPDNDPLNGRGKQKGPSKLRSKSKKSGTPQKSNVAWRSLLGSMRCKHSTFEIQKLLTGSLSACGSDKLLTTRLFFAIANPHAIIQLQDILVAMRRNDRLLPFPRPRTIGAAMEALERLESSKVAYRLQIRYNLVVFVNCYERIIQSGLRYGRRAFTDIEALANTVAEYYPHLERNDDAFQKMVSNFRSRLYAGRNWYRLVKRYGLGIIALVPTGSDFEIYDCYVQRISEQHFDDFLNILDEKRGDFIRQCSRSVGIRFNSLLKFNSSRQLTLERVDAEAVKKAKFDSAELLSLLNFP